MEKQPAEKRVFSKDLQDYFLIKSRHAERRFAQVRGFNNICRDGFVRWKHVYAWEDAINKGLAKLTEKGG
jgi:hypothetical protein